MAMFHRYINVYQRVHGIEMACNYDYKMLSNQNGIINYDEISRLTVTEYGDIQTNWIIMITPVQILWNDWKIHQQQFGDFAAGHEAVFEVWKEMGASPPPD